MGGAGRPIAPDPMDPLIRKLIWIRRQMLRLTRQMNDEYPIDGPEIIPPSQIKSPEGMDDLVRQQKALGKQIAKRYNLRSPMDWEWFGMKIHEIMFGPDHNDPRDFSAYEN